jgi:hypothetical protein
MTIYPVRHSYKDEIIVPYAAITNNVSFLFAKDEKLILTSDNQLCDIVDWYDKHICELSFDINRIYGITAWDFILRWHRAIPSMDSMSFVVIKLKKKDVQEK